MESASFPRIAVNLDQAGSAMGNLGRHMALALLASLGALPAGCVVGGFAYGIWLYLLPNSTAGLWPALGFGMFVALVAAFVGILPTFLYGAPAYAWFAARYRPSLVASLIIAALPGLALHAFSSELATVFLVFGVPVGCLLHVFAGCRMRRLRHEPDDIQI